MNSAKELKREHIAGAQLHANRIDMIAEIDLPSSSKIAEVGVAFGDFSRLLINRFHPTEFHAFDIFTLHEWPYIWGPTADEAFEGKTHEDFYRDRFANETCVKIYTGDSSTELLKLPDLYYDLIYIDGVHECEGVAKDAAAATQKLKKDGILVFNDYMMYDHSGKIDYGVVQVVNDLCVDHGWRVTDFALHNAMYCDIAIQRS